MRELQKCNRVLMMRQVYTYDKVAATWNIKTEKHRNINGKRLCSRRFPLICFCNWESLFRSLFPLCLYTPPGAGSLQLRHAPEDAVFFFEQFGGSALLGNSTV